MSAPSTRPTDTGTTPDSAARKVPGRAIGFTLMTLLILFAGFWMQHQSELRDSSGTQVMPDDTVNVAGFRTDAFYLPDDALLGFVLVPAGSFIMGSNPVLDPMAYENERWSASRRQGSVELDDFYIGRFEVTIAQFRAFALDRQLAIGASMEGLPGNLPVSNVTWPEALAYARWLEAALLASDITPPELRQALGSGAHVTLASEAEWEKAARGEDGRVFPWGSERTDSLANFAGAGPVAVGSIPCPPCSYGLSDMSGNVWEYTRSPLQDYPYDSSDDETKLSGEPLWVMRGGSFSDQINNVRAAVRGGVGPGVRSPGIGFRVVISSQ